MATSNSSRDVSLTLSVATLGQENVQRLQTALTQLASEGGAAAPQFAALASEIGRIGQQSQALNALAALNTQTTILAQTETEAAARVAALSTQLQAAGVVTTAAAQRQTEANAALVNARRAYADAGADLRLLAATTDSAGRQTQAYRDQVQALATVQATQQRNFIDLRLEVNSANAALRTATAEQSALAAAVARSQVALNTANAAVAANQSAVASATAAAQQLGVATGNVAAAQAALQQSMTAATAAAQALHQQTQAAAAAQAQVAAAARAAAQELQSAYGTLGVKSVASLQAEIQSVRAAMTTLQNQSGITGRELATAMSAGQARIAALEQSIRGANGALTLTDRLSSSLSSSLGQISAGNIVANGVSFLTGKVAALGSAFFEAITQSDQMTRGLNAIYKDSGVTASQIDFLRKMSGEAGVSVGGLGAEFVKFSAAMKSSNVPVEQSNALFASVTKASTSLGLSVDTTSGILGALGQMASKGVVSMEELRGQVGDRLPGALGLAAKGLNITEAQLVTLVSAGGLATRDFIAPFTNALKSMHGETDGLTPSIERFKGVLTEVAQGAGDAGWTQILGTSLKVLGGIVGYVAMGLSALSEAIFIVVKSVAALALAFTSPTQAMALFADTVEGARVRLTNQAEALNKFIDPASKATVATTTLGTATTATAAATGALTASTTAATAAQGGLTAAVAAGTATMTAAKDGLVAYLVQSAERFKAAKDTTDALEKLAKAAKAEGDTMVFLAKQTGDATVITDANTRALALNLHTLTQVSDSQKEELAVLIERRVELLNDAQARGLSERQIKAQMDALNALIKTAQAETEQAVQNTKRAQEEVFARNLATEALKNNAAQMGVYQAAVTAAKDALDTLILQEKNGQKTNDEVNAGRRELVRVQALYRDAVADTVRVMQLEAKERDAVTQASLAGKNAAVAHTDALIKQALASGDIVKADKLEISSKEQKLVIFKEEIAGRTRANEAALKSLEMSKLLVNGDTVEGKEKLRLIDVEIQLVKSKEAKNKASEESVKSQEKEIKGLKDAQNGVMSLVDAYHALGEKTPAELEKIAKTNEAVWEKIRGDSSATLEITKKAFTAYAQAAIDAAGDVGSAKRRETEEIMIAKGAVDGLTVSFDKMGKMTVQSQTEAANAINGTTSALGSQKGAIDAVTASLERQNAEQEKLVAAQEKTVDLAKRQKALDDAKRGIDGEGFVLGSDGKRLTGSGTTYYNKLQAYEAAKAKGLSDESAMGIGNTYGNDNIDYKDMRTLPFFKDQEAQNKKMDAAITQILFAEKQAAVTASKVGPVVNQITAPASTAAPVAHTYTVNIPSQNAQIGVSSDADAQALIRVLQNAKISAGA